MVAVAKVAVAEENVSIVEDKQTGHTEAAAIFAGLVTTSCKVYIEKL